MADDGVDHDHRGHLAAATRRTARATAPRSRRARGRGGRSPRSGRTAGRGPARRRARARRRRRAGGRRDRARSRAASGAPRPAARPARPRSRPPPRRRAAASRRRRRTARRRPSGASAASGRGGCGAAARAARPSAFATCRSSTSHENQLGNSVRTSISKRHSSTSSGSISIRPAGDVDERHDGLDERQRAGRSRAAARRARRRPRPPRPRPAGRRPGTPRSRPGRTGRRRRPRAAARRRRRARSARRAAPPPRLGRRSPRTPPAVARPCRRGAGRVRRTPSTSTVRAGREREPSARAVDGDASRPARAPCPRCRRAPVRGAPRSRSRAHCWSSSSVTRSFVRTPLARTTVRSARTIRALAADHLAAVGLGDRHAQHALALRDLLGHDDRVGLVDQPPDEEFGEGRASRTAARRSWLH